MIPRVGSLVVAWKRGGICKHERRRFLRLEHLADYTLLAAVAL